LPLAAPAAFAGPSSRPPTTVRVRINPQHVWTSTGVVLGKGDSATITAVGRAHFGAPPIDQLPPSGIPRGPQCAAASARQTTRGSGFPAPSLSCWSLIGRIGSAPPFEIGRGRTVHAGVSGELFVGVNDDYLVDNSDGWIVTVRATAPTSPVGATAPSAASGSSNRAPMLIAVGVAAIVALVGLALLWRKRRSRRAGTPEQLPAPVSPAAVAVEQPGGSATAMEGEVTAGNILDVTFPGPRTLRVTYNHFPEGTVVRWRIAQDPTVISGEFVTNGRGAEQHVVSVPLDTELNGTADAADVFFAWAIGGVAFNYAVRRNPEA
jgi:hypothetical protein